MGRRQRRREAGGPVSKPRPSPSGATDRSATSGRYTPPKRAEYRIRPGAHKVIGVVELVLGFAIIFINYVDYANMRLLPGGHQEGYFVLGMVIAAGSLWWFGWFDRTPTPDEVRREFKRERDQK